MVVDRFTIYFWYLFLAGAAISILMSVRYLEIEHENHGEFYALMLFSVVGMMCMAAGFDVVLIFIGLELMAISTYVLVGFLRTRPPLERSRAEISAAGRILLRHICLRLVAVLRPDRQHQPAGDQERPGQHGGGSPRSH